MPFRRRAKRIATRAAGALLTVESTCTRRDTNRRARTQAQLCLCPTYAKSPRRMRSSDENEFAKLHASVRRNGGSHHHCRHEQTCDSPGRRIQRETAGAIAKRVLANSKHSSLASARTHVAHVRESSNQNSEAANTCESHRRPSSLTLEGRRPYPIMNVKRSIAARFRVSHSAFIFLDSAKYLDAAGSNSRNSRDTRPMAAS